MKNLIGRELQVVSGNIVENVLQEKMLQHRNFTGRDESICSYHSPEFMEETMKKNKYFEIGDIVDMHCGEQGIVIEVIDDDWVLLLQCDGHVEKSLVGDIWKSNTEVDGKAELDSFFTKIFGYSSVYDEEELI